MRNAWRATKQPRVATTPTRREEEKSLAAIISELWQLVASYFKQETLDPLKSLRRFATYGLAGSFLLGVGFLLLALAGLRALELETVPHWTGSWSWLPYLVTMVGSVAVAVLLGWRITADKRKAERQRRRARKGV